MFCHNCGAPVPEESIFCPACGANLQMKAYDEPPVNLENQSICSFSAVLRKALCNGKFVAMCILVTASAVLSCAPVASISGINPSVVANIDIFAVLSTIAMWITYVNAKNTDQTMSASGLKFNMGIAKAVLILRWIAAIFVFFYGIIFCAGTYMLKNILADEALARSFFDEITALLESWGMEGLSIYFNDSQLLFWSLIAAIVMVVAGIGMILMNIFYYGKVKGFASNIYFSYITNKVTDLRFSTISVWFMVMGILSILKSIPAFAANPAVALSAASGAVSYIIASLWVKELGDAVSYIPMPIDNM